MSNLIKILESVKDIRCPNKPCSSYGSKSDCYMSAYLLCGSFREWYDKLTEKEKKEKFSIHYKE
jgi:hypothetical protein